jgi:hypothetical protein
MAQGTTRGVPIDVDPLLANNSDLLVPSQKAVKAYIDNGLSNKQNALGFTPEDVANKQTDLTASATKYPTVNAVNTGLATRQRKLFNLTPQVTHTGTTAKTIITSFYIPANTFSNGDFFNFSAFVVLSTSKLSVSSFNLSANTFLSPKYELLTLFISAEAKALLNRSIFANLPW